MGKPSAKSKGGGTVRVRATGMGFHNRRIREGEEFPVSEDFFKKCHAGGRKPSWFVRADIPVAEPAAGDNLENDSGGDGDGGGEDLT